MDEEANDSPCPYQAYVSRGVNHREESVAVARRNDADRILDHLSDRIHHLRDEKQKILIVSLKYSTKRIHLDEVENDK